MAALLVLLFSSFSLCWVFGQSAAGAPSLYVFGDSLVDVGNNNHILTFLKANFPHHGVDFPGGKATGRFSNGKNAVDWLAEKLGSPSALPYLDISSHPNKLEEFLNGISFASGGAGILNKTFEGFCISLNKQIEYFSTAYAFMVEEIGANKAKIHLSKSIFAIIIGSNDIFSYIRNNGSTPHQLVGSLISTLQLQLQEIYNFGARKFAFIGTGPLGCVPALRSNNVHMECNVLANSISDLYNQATASLLQGMKSHLNDMNYSFFNTSLLFQQLIQNPSHYGFAKVKVACCGQGDNWYNKLGCSPISSLCSNRTNSVFWDGYHPTEATAGLFAEEIVNGKNPFVYPLNVGHLAAL